MMNIEKSAQVILAHSGSSNHKDFVIGSIECGCFSCLKVFDPRIIKAWTDEGETALCPFCGVDSVLPDKVMDFDVEFLKDMHAEYFTEPTPDPVAKKLELITTAYLIMDMFNRHLLPEIPDDPFAQNISAAMYSLYQELLGKSTT